MSKILLFDNYDSFTYNLLHILKELGAEVEVHRNDKISLEEVDRFDKILLSPGPGIPEEAGHPASFNPPICPDKKYSGSMPRRTSDWRSLRSNPD